MRAGRGFERAWFPVMHANCIQVIKTTPITKMSKGGANEGATLLYAVMQQIP